MGEIADFEEQIKTFIQERGTALRYALEMVMKIANKQKTIKELGHVGEVHVRMRIRRKKSQKRLTSILRVQLTVEQLERLWSLRSMAKIELTSALLLLVAVLMAINKGQQEGVWCGGMKKNISRPTMALETLKLLEEVERTAKEPP